MKNKNIPIFFLVVFLAGLIMFLGFSQVRSEYQLEISKGLDYILSQPQDAWATMALAAAGEQDIDLTHLQTVPENQKSATTLLSMFWLWFQQGKIQVILAMRIM